ncbi:hypothetical protein [Flammeovirga pacifica]|uniref:WW domain-containing protein n=1 Tax=Flammeovirga pacifica TaxID=915059 RepID=A0A1S1Z087_FLAPC|nr:hypothetical protein [Flammeovirga pacifica]OHX66670.1 hypothetical protein NH26_10015 [Flammeovirga pacifica]
MKNFKYFSHNLSIIVLLLMNLSMSCNNDHDEYDLPPRPTAQLPNGCYWKWDRDDHEWERECDDRGYRGGYNNRNNPPTEKLPIGCHWEWEDDEQRWERDCD